MIASTTLQLKILKTKKRLYNDTWLLPIILITLTSLMVYLSFYLRAVSMEGKYGVIDAELPLVTVPFNDPSFSNFLPQKSASLGKHTSVLMLTPSKFIYGSAESFSTKLASSNNKFLIDHINGAPDTNGLIKDMGKWLAYRENTKKIPNDQILILMPTAEIPGHIVIQVVSIMKTSGLFKHVVLGGGLI